MGKDWTDAKYDVIGNHYRVGERNRDPKLRRWIYTGRLDRFGHPLWYRPPRLNRFGFFLFVMLLFAAGWVLLGLAIWSVQWFRSYWAG